MEWKQVADITNILSNFLGWVNHCVSPIFHVKGYRKGKLVYNGYNLHPHPTVHRDKFSWLPFSDIESDDGDMERHANIVQDALEGFANTWLRNPADREHFSGLFRNHCSRSRNHRSQSTGITLNALNL